MCHALVSSLTYEHVLVCDAMLVTPIHTNTDQLPVHTVKHFVYPSSHYQGLKGVVTLM